jgi:hypothetical protein
MLSIMIAKDLILFAVCFVIIKLLDDLTKNRWDKKS